MRRREFIAGLGGAAVWPLAAFAQQGERVRRIGVLMGLDESDPVANARFSAFTQALADLGWTDGRNVRMEVRWTGDGINRIRVLAQELVGLQPDIILAGGTTVTAALQRETRTIPIVFANVRDPVASNIVSGLSRPGGNITGFALYEPSLGGKWLQLLSEIAPGLRRAAIIFNPDRNASVYMPGAPLFRCWLCLQSRGSSNCMAGAPWFRTSGWSAPPNKSSAVKRSPAASVTAATQERAPSLVASRSAKSWPFR